MNLSLNQLELTSLTKAQFGRLLFEQLGLNKREAGDMVDAFFEIITEQLVSGQDVKISDFGNFLVRVKGARPGRNPKTGALVDIEPRRVVTFQAGPKLKIRLKG